MSRIGRRPVAIPAGVTVSVKDGEISVKGPKGALQAKAPDGIRIDVAEAQVRLARPDDSAPTRAKHGLARASLANMITGVTKGFVRELEIQGVGYRADVSGKTLRIQIGFSHPVEVPIPDGIKVSVDRNVIVRLEGVSRQQVGQFAADLRSIRPPEPYKGKGIRYVGEQLRRKVGKAGAGA